MLRQKSPDNLDKSFDLVTLNKSNQQGQRTATSFEVNLIYSYLRIPACDLPGPEPCQPCQSKELSALVSFEQLSLTEPTSSQFAMQRPHGKLWLKSQRQAGRYSSTNGLTLFHWEYTALLGSCIIFFARLLLGMAEIHSHLDKWLHFVTSVILQNNIPQLEGGREMEERQFEATTPNTFRRESPQKNTDNTLEGNRIFKANMNR